jgi:hypothetical protein
MGGEPRRPAQPAAKSPSRCDLWLCHHGAELTADRCPDEVPLPALGQHMVCSCWGIVGADVRPNWA